MRRFASAAGAVVALLLVGAPAAAALPQEIGDRCAANDSLTDATAIVLNNGAPFYGVLPPDVPPEGPKVITRWKVNAPAGIEPVSQQLLVFKQAGEAGDRLIGESALETVVGGAANEFGTRIPASEHAHIGLRGPDETLFCDHTEGHLGGIAEGPWAIGETREFEVESIGVPVIAYVEGDYDGDGYGDETQDRCPALASTQAPCPLSLTASAAVTKGAILVTVSTGLQGRAWVSGQIAWTAKPKAGAKKRKRLTADLSGGWLDIGYGASAVFTVPLPKAVKLRLGKLPPKKSLTARLNVEGIDVVGSAPALTSLTVKLPGRMKQTRPRR